MNKIEKEVKAYYDEKINTFGPTPQGVDWNSVESQELRFDILAKVINNNKHFSVLDYGCGFGSMFEFLSKKYTNFDYVGFDLSDKMIDAGKQKFINKNVTFTNEKHTEKADYVIASGIFNIKLENTDEDWMRYLEKTLKEIDALSKKGFSFNILTSYSDLSYMKDYLFYADPSYIFDFCKRNFSRNVALLHDYDLYEFTVIVRK